MLKANVLLSSLVAALIAGCGPNASVQLAAGPSVTPTAECVSVPQPVRVPLVPATAVVIARAVPGAQASAPTSVPRDQLVARAVATATAEARVPSTATPTPTPVPSPSPRSVAAPLCATPTARPVAGAGVSRTPVSGPPVPQVSPAVEPAAPPTPGRTGSPLSDGVAPLPSPSATLLAPRVLLASDANSEVVFHVGDRFVLLLGNYSGATDWQVQLSDPAILRRVGNDGQGVYEAARPGSTQINVVGNPACRNARPLCAAPSRLLRFLIRVV